MTKKLSKMFMTSTLIALSFNFVSLHCQSAASKTSPASAPKSVAFKKFDFEPCERDILQAKFGAAETKLKAILAETEKSSDQKMVLESLRALHLLGLTYERQQRIQDAEPLRQKALDLAKKTFGDKSAAYAQALADMGSLHALKGDVALAWQNNDQAQAIIDKAQGDNNLEKAAVNLAIARTRQSERSLGLADDFFKKALEETVAGSNKGENKETDSPATLLVCQEYALMLEKMDRKDEAKKLSERVTLAKTLTPSTTPMVIDAKAGLNKLIADAKKVEDAGDVDKTIESWKSTIAAIEKANVKDQRLAYCLVHLGSVLIEKKNYSEAQAILKKALDVRKNCSAPQNAGMARNLRRIGDCYMLEKNWQDATNFLVQAFEAEEAYGADDATKNTTLNKLASSCLQAKDFKRGENACRQILVLVEKSDSPAKPMKKMMATSMLAGMMMQSGRMQEGMQLMQNMAGSGAQMNQQNTQEYTAALKAEWDEVEKKSEEAELKTIFQ
ncbi:MAG: tetratricopeptide repeat protein [Cyanobacteria bacterium TGS_CYA1]|nr:tetratricopeptide repeat protein [Cyanobacteria bacterium TGS_CYA1]